MRLIQVCSGYRYTVNELYPLYGSDDDVERSVEVIESAEQLVPTSLLIVSFMEQAVQRVESHIAALAKLQNEQLNERAKTKAETDSEIVTVFRRPPAP